MRTLDRLGIASVAVFSDVDRGVAPRRHGRGGDPDRPGTGGRELPRPGSPARRRAQQRVPTPCTPATGSSSENAEFAAAVEAAGLAFVGPTPEQIRRFGAKDSARGARGRGRCTAASRVRRLRRPRRCDRARGRRGLPAAGEERRRRRRDRHARVPRRRRPTGGGRPRHAPERAGLRFAARCSSNEWCAGARHVEVQAFGDGEGGVVVIGDRDCSTQRRRQKVVEETPAPNLDDAVRAVLFEADACVSSNRSGTARRAPSSSCSTPSRASSRSSR